MRRATATALLPLASVALLAGCGGSSPAAGGTAQRQFVARANALCREARGGRVGVAAEASQSAELRALAGAGHESPQVASYITALARRQQLHAELQTALKDRQAERAISLLPEAYRLETSVYADAKALGLSACAGSPPRPPIGG